VTANRFTAHFSITNGQSLWVRKSEVHLFLEQVPLRELIWSIRFFIDFCWCIVYEPLFIDIEIVCSHATDVRHPICPYSLVDSLLKRGFMVTASFHENEVSILSSASLEVLV
jgi:hypothetical protein